MSCGHTHLPPPVLSVSLETTHLPPGNTNSCLYFSSSCFSCSSFCSSFSSSYCSPSCSFWSSLTPTLCPEAKSSGSSVKFMSVRIIVAEFLTEKPLGMRYFCREVMGRQAESRNCKYLSIVSLQSAAILQIKTT